jgi:hypothetical protein
MLSNITIDESVAGSLVWLQSLPSLTDLDWLIGIQFVALRLIQCPNIVTIYRPYGDPMNQVVIQVRKKEYSIIVLSLPNILTLVLYARWSFP